MAYQAVALLRLPDHVPARDAAIEEAAMTLGMFSGFSVFADADGALFIRYEYREKIEQLRIAIRERLRQYPADVFGCDVARFAEPRLVMCFGAHTGRKAESTATAAKG